MEASAKIFFIDDDKMAGELWLRYFGSTAHCCRVFRDPHKALANLATERPDLVITDLRMPGMSGTELLQQVHAIDAGIPVIIITAFADVDSVIASLRLGATDFIKKPYDMDDLRNLVEKTLAQVRLTAEPDVASPPPSLAESRYGMVGESDAMREVYRMIDKLAEARCNVIIEGESGTGKELAARAIHNLSPQRNEPFVVIDCGSITDTLLESELFGCRRGAFTGADSDRVGLLESAGKGTVFLDEIGNISDAMQTKLLRVLQEGTLTPVGRTQAVSIHARFLTATNRNLSTLVEERRFRHDLFHRLNVVTLTMPSLRGRRTDIPALIQHFTSRFSAKYQRPGKCFSAEKIKQMCELPWTGNVRELQNYIERSFIMSDGACLDLKRELPAVSDPAAMPNTQPSPSGDLDDRTRCQELDQIEAQHIQQVLESVGGNQSKAAELLGIHRSTLWRKLRLVRTQYA